ncbi:putative transcription factor interactor and regulator CCHC(Zn) family [Rosa chinensis]|uniref:Putative transcription factor interactor and regulator CCHC(Zn) family n=1 Tax=Rosa chinensis TaxID=74649 RepID=A0A2P6R933_ROSCH|nr:putative transcription factor interactor and regulator CCHC(Zn) family [Rosa chinensis]
MTGFFAGRGRGRLGGSGRGFPTAGRGFAGGNYNPTGFTDASTFASQSGNTFSCQLCGKPGHGARTCRTLSQYQPFVQPPFVTNSVAGVECQYCKKKNHTADRCYHIIGFPSHQQQSPPLHPSAMLASSSATPQFWLADSGATNHMTSEVQLLNNVAPYNASDTVQVGNGQGAGKNSLSGTE